MNAVPNRSRHLSARDAASSSALPAASLYAYVSRGASMRRPIHENPRKSRYPAADVERLRDQQAGTRLHPDIAARKSLSWGIPILESGLTLIDEGRFITGVAT